MNGITALVSLGLASILAAPPPATVKPEPEGSADLPPLVQTEIDWIGLFKNGYAIVERSVQLPPGGVVDVANLPAPVHGTYWVESDAVIASRLTTRETRMMVDLAPNQWSPDRYPDGVHVTIERKDGEHRTLSGRLRTARVETPSVKPEANRALPDNGIWSTRSTLNYLPDAGRPAPPPAAASPYLMLEDDATGELCFLDRSLVASMRFSEPPPPTEQVTTQNVLRLESMEPSREPATVRITYLTKGIAWAPSYRVDLSDSSLLTIEQKAVIRNELEDLNGAEVELISGFPNIEFAETLSPFASGNTWARFFSDLRGDRWQDHSITSNVVMLQSARRYEGFSETAFDRAGTGSAQDVDVYYHSIGRHSLKRNEAVDLDLGQAAVEYERFVQWTISGEPEEGAYRASYDHDLGTRADAEQNPPWDVIRFRNPFDRPMTTAPATLVNGRRLLGQHTSLFTSPGSRCVLPITRALSIRAVHDEWEEPGERVAVTVRNRRYRRADVTAVFTIRNLRTESISMEVHRTFEGELIESEGEPRRTLTRPGVNQVNRETSLFWAISLEPGEERTITYRYHILIRE